MQIPDEITLRAMAAKYASELASGESSGMGFYNKKIMRISLRAKLLQ